MKIDATTRLKPADGVHARRFDNELVVLDLAGGQYYGLDEIGAIIWESYADGRCASEIASAIVEKYDATYEQVEADVRALAQSFVEKRLFVVTAA